MRPRIVGLSIVTILVGSLVHAQDEAAREVPRFEVGPVFNSIFLTRAIEKPRPAVGVRFTYNFSPRIALDSDLAVAVTMPVFSSTFEGGRLTQGQFGLKMGSRREWFGIFGKARPGFVSFPGVVKGIPEPGEPLEVGRSTMFSLDVGGVVELYPSQRVVVRYDLGDTFIRYPEFKNTFEGTTFTIPSKVTSNFQFSTSVQFRF